MKRVFYIVVIPLLLTVSLQAYSQSNKGTEFWTAFMCHNANTGNVGGAANMVLYITSDLSTQGQVEVGGRFLTNFTIEANKVTFVDIPITAHMATQDLFSDRGIHITSERPIAIYAHIYASNVSGATLLLPVSAMGKEYMSLNYMQVSNAPVANPAYSTFAVIGTEDNTSVSITPTANLMGGQIAGVPFTITLNKGEVFQGLSTFDLTGTKIQSVNSGGNGCQKIAVFSGSSRMGIGCNTTGSFSSDNLFQQVYPTATWGKNYIAAPLLSRPYDVYRIVLSDPNTNVVLNGVPVDKALFSNDYYYEFSSTQTNVVSADKPIQVVQYSPTQNQTIDCNRTQGDVGDPEMIYLSPIEQGLNRVTLYSTGRFNISQSFVNVIIPTSAASTLTLDGTPYAAFTSVPGTNYSYAQIRVAAGSHTLNASVPFNAIAYGFGNTESYGYAAGTNLQDLNTNVVLKSPADADDLPLTTGCSDKTYKLQVTIPYKTTNIVWRIDGDVKQVITNPVEKSTKVNGDKTLYTYEYPTQVTFAAGTHLVVATVFNPNADVCGSNQDIENVFSITDPPGKDFIVAASNCLGDSTLFKDNTATTTSNVIKSWLWDFGDGTTSTLQNPSHLYAAAGDYPVRLTVGDYSGCTTVSNIKTVHIIPRPVANFTISIPDCVGREVKFTDTSTPVEPGAVINKWQWDFSDGTTSTEQNPIHQFAEVKTYDVKLTVTTATGCISTTKITQVTIHPLPVANFNLPDACVMDRNSQFTSTSTIDDNSASEFVYEWTFGDPGSGAANTSTLANPQHSFSREGNYTIILKVTSKYGCVDIKEQVFTVNSADPHPKFTVKNVYNCSTDGLTFVDESKPDFGSVTRLRFYYDLVNKPTEYKEFYKETLRADKTYHIDYPVNNTGTLIPYKVKLVAFTGTGAGCTAETLTQEVYMNPNPVVRLQIGDVELTGTPTYCQSDPAVQVTGIPDHGLQGRHQFTGPGISSNGLFNPKLAGPGTHTIAYKFIVNDANTACEYNTSFQVLVNPNAEISLPTRHTVLEGSQITLRPTVNLLGGGNMTYQWAPAAGLSQTNVLNTVVTITEDATYTLKVTSVATGCVTEISTFVKVLKVPLVPNAFTPNGDGINDTWEIKYLNDYPNATVEIFSRNGNRVYYSNGYAKAWDGRFNGGDLPLGTYYYIISPNSGRKPVSGYISIIR